MGNSFVRPRVADLVFRLYDRPLHPELFEVLATRTVDRDGYAVTATLTRTGHALDWSNGHVRVVEVTATGEMDLPNRGQRLALRFDGTRGGKVDCGLGIRYQVSTQLEVLPTELFVHAHEELAVEGAYKGMVFHCHTENRLGLSPLGVVIVQTVPTGLSLASFHTFPDELAIIKTQSLIEWE